MRITFFCSFTIAAFFYGSFCSAQKKNDHFILTGKVLGRDTGRLILTYTPGDGHTIDDTVMLRNGTFTFSGNIDQPTQATLEGRHLVPPPYYNIYDPNFLLFYLEPGKINVTLRENDYAHAVVTGSVTQRQNDTLQQQLAPVLNKLLPLNNEYEVLNVNYVKKKTDTALARMEALLKQIQPLSNQVAKIEDAFLLAHPDSYVSADILDEWVDPGKMGGDSAMMYYRSTTKKIQNSPAGRRAYKNITTELLTEKGGAAAAGAVAPDFSQKDQHDELITLSSFRNKNYILLDFWASWCVPCMNASPRIKQLYKQYHHKGLQIIGLSMDISRDKWLAALQHNALSLWPQVYLGNLYATGNLAHEKYGVLQIPQYILIDKAGKIIGRYDDTDEASAGISLAEELKRIFQ